jgi:nucleoside-diphosphate-sugar epimerase
MNILVTGGSGTIGGYVLRELMQAGHTVTSFSRTAPRVPGAGVVTGDIMDLEALAAAVAGHEAVVHLAAVPGPRRAAPEQLLTINVIGTVHVLEAAVRAGAARVVLASSGAATGFSFQVRELTPRYLPLDEEHPCEPHDEYGLSKLLAELACKRYSDAFGLQTLCLRINHNWCLDREGAEVAVRSGWAKGSVEELWTNRYRKVIEAEDSAVWPVPGPPSPKNLLWAVTDIRDAARAFRLAAENTSLRHEVFQINAADTCSTIATPELIARHYPDVPVPAPLAGHASLISHAKATRLLGYQPRYTWRQSDFMDWLQQQRLRELEPQEVV